MIFPGFMFFLHLYLIYVLFYIFILACFYMNVLAAPHDFEMKDIKKYYITLQRSTVNTLTNKSGKIYQTRITLFKFIMISEQL